MEQQETKTPRPASEIALDIANCTKCHLHETRLNTVPGEGPNEPEIMMIGEGPGKYEDRDGKPFVGASGGKLATVLKTAGIRRSDIFITNVVKCRTPNNRTPTPEETKACRPWLEEQIKSLNPKLIITMGGPATQWFKPNAKITEVRGNIEMIEPGRIIMPILHTAYAARRPTAIQSIEDDFKNAAKWLEILRIDPEQPNPYEPNPPQDEKADETPDAETEDEPATEEEIRPMPAKLNSKGPMLEAADWVMRRMQKLSEPETETGDPRKARHHMNLMAMIIKVMNRHLEKMPKESNYLNMLIRPRMAAAVKAGKTLNQTTPHICLACHREFYSENTSNTRKRYCPNCE